LLFYFRLLILLFICSSQCVYAEDYLKSAKDGQPNAQYQHAMNLLKESRGSEALDWLIIAAAQGHLKSSFWIKQNTDYQQDKFLNTLVKLNAELENKIKPYSSGELKEMKAVGNKGDSDTQLLMWLLYVNNLYITKPKAYVWIKKSAGNKQPRALFGLGLLYYYGYIVPEQKNKAFSLFNESAELSFNFASLFLKKFVQAE
jgi:TPR repeat protein